MFEAQVSLVADLQKPLFVHLRERDVDKGEPLGMSTQVKGIAGVMLSISRGG